MNMNEHANLITTTFVFQCKLPPTDPPVFLGGHASPRGRFFSNRPVEDPVDPHLGHRSSMVDWMIRMHNKAAMELWGQMGVSENRGTPKWMVYNGKPY